MSKLLSVILLLNLLGLHNVFADDDPAPEPFPNSTTPTTSKPSPIPTKPITVIPPNATTTVPPTSTTSITTSTTSTTPTSTTPPTTSATTSVTTTSASTAATTTAAPTPAPKPKQGTWQVNNNTGGNACILVKMAALIEVNYTDDGNKTEEGSIPIPIDANATGNCGNDEQFITLKWPVAVNVTDTVEFTFKKNGSKFELEVVNITLTLDPAHFPHAKDVNRTLSFVHKKIDFVTPVKMSYKCAKLQTLSLNTTDTNITFAAIKISDFQFQAFGNITNQKFAEANDCEPYETPDIVPIAVGCALMALIIIVLIGYLIGRRRNQARGYLSMVEE